MMEDIDRYQPTGKVVLDVVPTSIPHVKKDRLKPDFTGYFSLAWAFQRSANPNIEPAYEADYSTVQSGGRIFMTGHGEKGGYGAKHKVTKPWEHGQPPPSIENIEMSQRILDGNLVAMTQGATKIPEESFPVYIIYTRCQAGNPGPYMPAQTKVSMLSSGLKKHGSKNIYVIGGRTNTIKFPGGGDYIWTRTDDERHSLVSAELNSYEELSKDYLESQIKEYKSSKKPGLLEQAILMAVMGFPRKFMWLKLNKKYGAYTCSNFKDYQVYLDGEELIGLENTKAIHAAFKNAAIFKLLE